jgi:cell fate regulator YaaT (PSP1 superfamily)
MGCGNCGSGANGKPAGCKSNGGCSSGGCNKMNVFDWLGTIPLPGGAKPFPIVEVSFNNGSRKEYFKNNAALSLHKGQWVTVEGVGGFDMGEVSLTGELVKLQMKKYGVQDQTALKRIMRPASEEDLGIFNENKKREKEIMVRSRAIAKEMKVDMKIGEVELQADGKKATFFYTAEHRVDFRELIKVFASDFKIKVEMRQIGARQESGKVGGIGSCGRELCCSTWLTDFKSVNTTAARYQSLSINQTKLSGQCGRLKCCLNFELDTYMDALRHFPNHADHIQTAQGKASLIKKDIFRNLMWYSFSGSSKQYPLTIERVNEILAQNKEGIFPEELQAVELEGSSNKEKLKIDVGFVNDVGQITLKNLEKKKSKNKNKKPNKSGNSGNKLEGVKPAARPNAEAIQNNNARTNKTKPPQQQNAVAKQVNANNGAPKTNTAKPNNRPPQQQRPQQNNNRKPRPDTAAQNSAMPNDTNA